jgi:hypothetical protein
MNLPSIPTDNLYKFMALSGILLVIAAFIPQHWYYNLQIEYQELDGEANILMLKNEKLILEGKKIVREHEKLTREGGILFKELAKRTTKELGEMTKEYDKILLETAEKAEKRANISYENKIAAERLLTLKKILVLKRRRINLYMWIANINFSTGILLTIWGFGLWYFKLQKYQDKIIKKPSKNNK